MRYVILTILALLLLSDAASACSCIVPGEFDAAAQLAENDAVFAGKVTRVEELSKRQQVGEKTLLLDRQFRVTFQVKRLWKGRATRANSITIITQGDSAACGYNFEKDREYLVFAMKENDVLNVSLCSETAQLEKGESKVKALGRPRQVKH